MDRLENIFTWVKEKGQSFTWIALGLIASLIFTVFLSYAHFKPEEEAPRSDVLAELLRENELADATDAGEILLGEETKTTEGLDLPMLRAIVVDIKGAVQAPGVYQMEEGTRIIDAVEKAGGLLAEAETIVVNFSQILADQMVIYIPKVGEELPQAYASLQIIEETTAKESIKININTAEKEELMTLKGIGNAKADNILAYREASGFFKTIEDIKNVSGIGDATFAELKDSIVVSP